MEQGFWAALFSTKVESTISAQKILKLAFAFCSYPIIVIALIHMFFPDIFTETIASDQITIISAYIFGTLMILLGWLIHNRFVWAAYITIIIIIGPAIYDAITEQVFPSFSWYDCVLILIISASIRSISCLKREMPNKAIKQDE